MITVHVEAGPGASLARRERSVQRRTAIACGSHVVKRCNLLRG